MASHKLRLGNDQETVEKPRREWTQWTRISRDSDSARRGCAGCAWQWDTAQQKLISLRIRDSGTAGSICVKIYIYIISLIGFAGVFLPWLVGHNMDCSCFLVSSKRIPWWKLSRWSEVGGTCRQRNEVPEGPRVFYPSRRSIFDQDHWGLREHFSGPLCSWWERPWFLTDFPIIPMTRRRRSRRSEVPRSVRAKGVHTKDTRGGRSVHLDHSDVKDFLRKSPLMGNDRRKFRNQTSDNMDRWKAEQGRGREKRKIRREKIRRERVRRKKIQMREKVGKSRNTVFFQWCVAPEGRKVGSLKRRVRSQLARWEMKNCTPLWREAHFQVKMYKTHQVRTTFGSYDVEKVHAVVARSRFPSQNVQNTSASDHFWKLWCRKSARRCGAKHISRSKCTKHRSSGPLLEVAMSKKCTPLWREAHFQVKSVKNWRSRTTFGGSDVEKVSKKCTPLWREAHLEVKSVRNWGFCAFFDVLMSKK